jgi:hypothetical protein
MFPSVQRMRPVHAGLALAMVALLAALGQTQSDEQPKQGKQVATRSVPGTPIVGAVVAINNVADYNWTKVSGGGGIVNHGDGGGDPDGFADNADWMVRTTILTLSGPLVTPRRELTGWYKAMQVRGKDDPFLRAVTVWAMMPDGQAAEAYGYGDCYITRYVFPKLVVGSSVFAETLVIKPGYLLAGDHKISNVNVRGVVSPRGVQERALPTATGQPVSFRVDIPGLADPNSRVRSIEIGDTVWPVVDPGQPGQPGYGDITIRCQPQAGRYELRDWWIQVANGAEIRKDITIQLLDSKGEACRTYNMISCIPRTWTPGDYDPANTATPALETLVIKVLRVEMS